MVGWRPGPDATRHRLVGTPRGVAAGASLRPVVRRSGPDASSSASLPPVLPGPAAFLPAVHGHVVVVVVTVIGPAKGRPRDGWPGGQVDAYQDAPQPALPARPPGPLWRLPEGAGHQHSQLTLTHSFDDDDDDRVW